MREFASPKMDHEYAIEFASHSYELDSLCHEKECFE
jgi:hypothetical protein